MGEFAVRAENLSFAYSGQDYVLRAQNLSAAAGTMTCIVGPSGVGKSTLLLALAGVIPAEGTMELMGAQLPRSASARARLRLRSCGFVFQRGELLAELNVVDNVALPLRLQGIDRQAANSRVVAALERFGIAECADRDPSEISGGQAQRASVARALIHEPAVVFADEPTGSLDAASRRTVVEALIDTVRHGACVIVATHDAAFRDVADQVVELGLSCVDIAHA